MHFIVNGLLACLWHLRRWALIPQGDAAEWYEALELSLSVTEHLLALMKFQIYSWKNTAHNRRLQSLAMCSYLYSQLELTLWTSQKTAMTEWATTHFLQTQHFEIVALSSSNYWRIQASTTSVLTWCPDACILWSARLLVLWLSSPWHEASQTYADNVINHSARCKKNCPSMLSELSGRQGKSLLLFYKVKVFCRAGNGTLNMWDHRTVDVSWGQNYYRIGYAC